MWKKGAAAILVGLVIASLAIAAAGAARILTWQHDPNIDRTVRGMAALGSALGRYNVIHQSLPHLPLQEMPPPLASEQYMSQSEIDSSGEVAAGRDAWGTPLQFHVEANGEGAIVRSRGPNRVDDGGRGDDLTYRTALIYPVTPASDDGRQPSPPPPPPKRRPAP